MNPPMHDSNQLTSFLHGHPLTLMVRNPLVPSRTHRTCDVCRESIDGDFYGCNHCHFHVHQYCTRLPDGLRHVIDPRHKLSLLKLSSGRCSVCQADCASLWVYACTACKVNIHLNCLRKPFGRSSERTDRPSGSRGIRHQHHAPPPPPPPWLVTGNTSYQFGHHGPVQYFPQNNYPSYHTNYHGTGHGHGHGGHGHGHDGGYGYGHGHGHGGHGHDHGHGGHGHGHGHGSSSGFGSKMGSVMFTLVQNLAMGAFAEFIFGSIEF